MKNKIYKFLMTVIMVVFPISVSAAENLSKDPATASSENLAESPISFCSQTATIWQIVGWILLILKIVIPVILIILGIIDLSKAVLSSKDDAIMSAAKRLMFRAIAAVAIFFIPTVINIVMGLIDDFRTSGAASDFKICRDCLYTPGKCDTSKDVGKIHGAVSNNNG